MVFAIDGKDRVVGVDRQSILRDVARAAGVSMRTASRVLNNDPHVADTTRRRVQDVMRDLRYTPDSMARSLRAGTDATIGLVVESVDDPFFSKLVAAVETAASEADRSVLIASTHRDAERERNVVEQLIRRRVSGLLLAPTASDHAWLRPMSLTTPVVLWTDRRPVWKQILSVSTTTQQPQVRSIICSDTAIDASPTSATTPRFPRRAPDWRATGKRWQRGVSRCRTS